MLAGAVVSTHSCKRFVLLRDLATTERASHHPARAAPSGRGRPEAQPQKGHFTTWSLGWPNRGVREC